MAMEKKRLPNAELEVMQALWEQEAYPVSSARIMEGLIGREWKLPTLLKLLSRLEKRGFIQVEKDGRGNLYTPIVKREDYLKIESRSFFARLHGGSFSSLMVSLVDEQVVSEKLIQELEAMLKEHRHE